jgi:hypothetical protein
MLILTKDTVRNPAILKVRQLPRKFFGRVTVWPKGRVGLAGYLRIMIEFQWLRYTLALLPLVIIGLIWNGLALPLAQAPIVMLIIIWWIEMRVLRVPKSKRGRVIDRADADRALNTLRVQARSALTRIAAGRGMRTGQLHLVIEQSDLALLAPLTYVSVQSDDGPEVIALDLAERDILRETLFQPPLDERLLQRINQAENLFLRDISFDARAVSAHARLDAALR